MEDLQYQDVLFSQEYREALSVIQHGDLKPIAGVLVQNLNRLASLTKLPAFSVYWAQYAGILAAELTHKQTGKYLSQLTEKEHHESMGPISVLVTRHIKARADEYADDESARSRDAWVKP